MSTDSYSYQGNPVTLVSKNDDGTECTIRLADGTEKTVASNEITVEHHEEEAPKAPEPPAQS